MSQSINDDFLFADAHVHFYDMNHPTLHYGHWQPDEDHQPRVEEGNVGTR